MIRGAVVTAQRPYAELVREAEKARLLLDAARPLGETLEPERVYTRFRALLADAVEHELVEGLVGQMAASVRVARLRKERSRLEAAEAAARAVAAEREQAASVLEAVGDGIFLVDDAGCVRLWNRAAEVVTGLRAVEVRD